VSQEEWEANETSNKQAPNGDQTMKPSKLALLFREINQIGGNDAGFLANVILHHHQRPVRKLHGLLTLLRAGKRVQTAQFRLDVLTIDGQRAEWSELERSNQHVD
jgi:hypothetical protein